MEMPDINLAHVDLNKYDQAPNHLADHLLRDFVFRGKVTIYIYTCTCGISRKPLNVCRQMTEHIYIFSF